MNTLSIAQSGLQAAQTRLNVSANNVANAQTEGFRRDQVQAAAQADGGVRTQVNKMPQSGAHLIQDLLDQKSATYAFKANLQTVKATDEMMGRLLDVRA